MSHDKKEFQFDILTILICQIHIKSWQNDDYILKKLIFIYYLVFSMMNPLYLKKKLE